MIRLTRPVLMRRYGDSRAIGSLAAMESPGRKRRLAHDGTHEVAINNRVRCRGRRRVPTLGPTGTRRRQAPRRAAGGNGAREEMMTVS